MDDTQNQFVADAKDIVERLYTDLEQLRAVRLQGRQRRELAARIFRYVHTLKGSAGSFGLKSVSDIAHEFEGVLDGVRLGRVSIDDSLLDLFEDAAHAIAQRQTARSPKNCNGLLAIVLQYLAQRIAASVLRLALEPRGSEHRILLRYRRISTSTFRP